ncbi:enoyl-CoA hydratase/isomerase family protein [Salinirarus marinus]|uniref:enoyl-CoA hydratase/isomerase family protein n=1 Tax=Salinirarus marinus TaxID=3068310 RepID=UPI003C6C0322
MTVLQREAITDEILRLTLNRPETLNALNTELLREIPAAFEEAEREGRQVVVVEGSGDAFCSGADLDEASEEGEDIDLIQEITRAVRGFDGIVIGKLHGYAVGGGLEFSLSFDLRYAATGTVFKMPETELGVPISNASTKLLPLYVGLGVAQDLVYTSREMSAAEAERHGLVSGVYDPDELEREVLDRARDLVENKSETVLGIHKRAFNHTFPIEEALEYERLLNAENEASGGELNW